MFRNIAALLLVGSILYFNYKLNYTERIILLLLMCCFALGNYGFYFLDKYPNSKFWNLLINEGHYWHEFPVTASIMVILIIYIISTKQRCKNKKN